MVALLLGDYQGYLQTDDHGSYLKIRLASGLLTLNTWRMHVENLLMRKVMPSKKSKIIKADVAVEMIAVLYRIETEINDKTAIERIRVRQQKSIPQLDKIWAWLDKALENTLPKRKAGLRLPVCIEIGKS